MGQDNSVSVETGGLSRRSFVATSVTVGLTMPWVAGAAAAEGSKTAAEATKGRAATKGAGPDPTVPADGDPAGGASSPDKPVIGRRFRDSRLELVRLLREAAEIEHALMLQYFYAAFSLKPAYAALAGNGVPNTTDLLGIAVQEMRHLGAVNRLLVALDASPHLQRQDFPYEPDIYPFPFHLEPLTGESLARYAFTEAPAHVLTGTPASPEDALFVEAVARTLGSRRPNRVGSLYDTVIGLVEEVGRRPEVLPDVDHWLKALTEIKAEGELGHYHFFRDTLLGRHPALAAYSGGWKHKPGHPEHPSCALPVDPTAFANAASPLPPAMRRLAWLGDLHYWIVLCLLDVGYRTADGALIEQARLQMVGPMLSLARHLATREQGLAFDVLSQGHSPGRSPNATLRLASLMVAEAQTVARAAEADLPGDFPGDAYDQTLLALQRPIGDSQAAPDRTGSAVLVPATGTVRP